MLCRLFTTGSMPDIGELAPDFTTTDTHGVEHRLAQLVTAGPVVLVFFPRAFTPICTRELSEYRARYAELKTMHVEVLAISTDSDATQREFQASLRAPFPFIAGRRLVDLYAVRAPLFGWAMRTTFLVGQNRRVLGVWQGTDAAEPTGVMDMLMNPRRGNRNALTR